MVRARGRLAWAAVTALVAGLALTACSQDYNDSPSARWLRTAGDHDESPEVINCMDDAMHALLSDDELSQWLAQDPTDLTVETLQSLPGAIEVADRCRHLL